MSQGTTILPTVGTVSGLTMVGDMNAALDALLTNNSGSSAPSSPEAYQFWLDTSGTNKLLKQRNGSNNAWIIVGWLDVNNIFHFAAGSLPNGHLFNGKISRTVSSNNLTVAVKTWGGADPSAADPVFVCINNTILAITAALSVTKNAGTNWCNFGGFSTASNEDTDFFVYIGYNATDGVVIGFSRIPWGRIYSDFSATSTNETYCAISNITHAAAGDFYEVIGRFNAMCSNGIPNYYWSVPGTSIIIDRPIYETRYLGWTPTITGLSGITATCKYKLVGTILYLKTAISGTSTTTAFTFSLPFNAGETKYSFAWVQDNSVYQTNPGLLIFTSASGTVTANKDGAASAWTASGTKAIVADGAWVNMI
jgi:hypothetical protein